MENNDALSRRTFVKNSLMLATLPAVSWPSLSGDDGSAPTDAVALHWLDGKSPALASGATWGVPWAKGVLKKNAVFSLQGNAGENLALQSWPLAYWPDGSLKWTAHAIGAHQSLPETFQLTTGKAVTASAQLSVAEQDDAIVVNTGIIACTIAKTGTVLIRSISRDRKIAAQDGKLVLTTQNNAEITGTVTYENFESSIRQVTVEQRGPVRAVVKLEGKHAHNNGRSWLPFVIRLYFYEGSEAIRIMHTIIYDGDEHKDIIKGLGVRFSVPLNDALHNRHVRFAGENKGVFAEAVRGLTGLRRDPGDAIRAAQRTGKATPPLESFPEAISKRLDYIPAFGDYTLFQPTADSFEIRKRTETGYGWIHAAHGNRAAGTAYVGTPEGGIAFGIRNFWQSYPAQLDISKAHTTSAEVTMWLWAPQAEAMDLRFYHDGLGQDTFAKQLEGLEITYEDYEPGFGTPEGIARTSELQLWMLPATPSNEKLNEIAAAIQQPPQITFSTEYWQKAGVFGGRWNVTYQPSPRKEKIREQLGFYFDYYRKQVDQHHWYGFWNYGDVMHSYDRDRHQWRYDVGGYAWDNSELSTDIWLWHYFLYSGRADVFRMAEAMTRHTGEVDVHHLGKFSPLGSRHNVQHWGCSAKQLRISTVENRRFYYYLTADERVGDLMREQLNADRTLRDIVPGRKIGQKAAQAEGYASISFGTDWGALAAAWFTEWERTGDKQIMNKLLNSMRTIAQQPHGFFTGGAEMELSTGKFAMEPKDKISASHLSAVFGLAEICAELVDAVNMPEFEKAWVQYCELYNATPEEQTAALGESLGKLNLQQGHSRLTAFAAIRKKDARLAARAWKEFFDGVAGFRNPSQNTRTIAPPEVLNPVEEADVSTNAVAQWGLSAMALVAMLGDQLE
ncbi:Tat pathway signal sequence domain protein [Fulvivirgaceae bacterium PWU4]|uniref:Tat pathway signal sequence domain protein n=1 Tax=Chryseosolibacter histidini TaxID=2782349 RepID=A0AAP2DHT4_9BACT|nr:Tat pathway signal sequence domain protein [Chryseosolibacter histidini]MBT1695653.1 Tat pathway signal sequence domain protein [Chryseosolibacter histidini]